MFEEKRISNEKNLLGSAFSFSNSENSGKKPPANPTPVAGEKRGRKGKAKAGSSTIHDGQGEQSDLEVHIWTERERRKKMRNMFSTLHALLPHLPPKTDKSSIVDEAINYIQNLEQTLKTLQKQRLDKFRSPTIADLEPSLTIAPDQTRVHVANPSASSRNSSIASNIPSSDPIDQSQACFRTWFFPYVVINLCGNDAQICVCSSRKPGLLATICYILERHKVEVVSANISSDHHRSMFMIHVHADGPSAQFPQASIEETFKLAVGEIVSWLFSY